jgi:hypothetical protein
MISLQSLCLSDTLFLEGGLLSHECSFWLTCVWSVWKAMNKMVFEVEAVFENVKISSWNWLNVKNRVLSIPNLSGTCGVLGTPNHIEAE